MMFPSAKSRLCSVTGFPRIHPRSEAQFSNPSSDPSRPIQRDCRAAQLRYASTSVGLSFRARLSALEFAALLNLSWLFTCERLTDNTLWVMSEFLLMIELQSMF